MTIMKRVLSALGIGIVCLCVIVFVPLLINSIVLKASHGILQHLAGNTEVERVWLSVLASFSGCVFSAMVTFVVLYLTIKQNNSQNEQNRANAHQENLSLKETQERQFRYIQEKQRVDEIRSLAVSYYHSVANAKVDSLYTMLSLDRIEDLDFKVIRSLLLDIKDLQATSYIELKMMLSFDGDSDAEAEQILKRVKEVSDECYATVSDLVWFYILCERQPLSDTKPIEAEVYKYSAQYSSRFNLPDYRFIWDIIIENDRFDIWSNRFAIVSAWHNERGKVEDCLLNALRGLVKHYYDKQMLIK